MPPLERSRAAGLVDPMDERTRDEGSTWRRRARRRPPAAAGARIALYVALGAAWAAGGRRSRSCGSSGGRSRRISSSTSSKGAACRRSYHLDRVGFRTQQVSNLVIGDPKHPDLDRQVAPSSRCGSSGRQLRGVSDRRARRPAARPAGPRQGQLGPDRQAAAAAEQQAVPAARIRARYRRQQHRARDSVRAGRHSRCRAMAS